MLANRNETRGRKEEKCRRESSRGWSRRRRDHRRYSLQFLPRQYHERVIHYFENRLNAGSFEKKNLVQALASSVHQPAVTSRSSGSRSKSPPARSSTRLLRGLWLWISAIAASSLGQQLLFSACMHIEDLGLGQNFSFSFWC